jgi:hypothetical protein
MPDGLLDDGRFYKLEKTCRVCRRTERIAVWNRIGAEIGASMMIERGSSGSSFVCPNCVRFGKHTK